MTRYCYILLFLSLSVSLFAHDHTLPPGFFMEQEYVSGLNRPTDIKIAPDGRLFVTEKKGTVRIVENGVLLDQPFYSVNTQTVNERGLGGILLDPDFDNNGYVYLYYTLTTENKNILARVTAAGNTAVPGSEIELFRFGKMWAAFHNGGGMVFDSTGCILVGTGDGTGFTSAQNFGETLGKIIRIKPDGTIPTDNPFYNTLSGEYRAIAAYGLRNPFTMGRSKLTGQIFINDVGNDDWEEVNEYSLGANFGWHLVEGPLGNDPPPDSNYSDPIHAYDHDYGCAVVGASFYEPTTSLFPQEYYGKFFFHEYCEGILMCMDPSDYSITVFGSGIDFGYVNLEVSHDGYLYMVNNFDGTIARISYVGVNAPPLIAKQPASAIVPVGEYPFFTVEATGDNNTYDWYINDTLVKSGIANSFVMKDVQMADSGSTIHVLVNNAFGFVSSDTVMLVVINGERPQIQFVSIPTHYSAGDTIHFEANVSDKDQASIPLTDWTWKIDFHHDEHVHPAYPTTTGISSGDYFVETFGEVDTNVWYRIHLNVTDSSGLNGSSYFDVIPNKVTLHFESNPPGVEISIDGTEHFTDYGQRSVHKLNRTVEIPRYNVVGDSLYQFQQWFDGQDTLTRTFVAQNDTITMDFKAVAEYIQGYPSKGILTIYGDTAVGTPVYDTIHVSKVNENWDILNPFPHAKPKFPNDYWDAVWSGPTVAPVTDTFTFFLRHDAIASLWIGDSLLVDQEKATSWSYEDTARIFLNAGDSVWIIVDYRHHDYIARVELDWEYSIVDRYPVPFMNASAPVSPPPPPVFRPHPDLILYPNPSSDDEVTLFIDSKIYPGLDVVVNAYDERGRRVGSFNGNSDEEYFTIDVHELAPGLYYLRTEIGKEVKLLKYLRRD